MTIPADKGGDRVEPMEDGVGSTLLPRSRRIGATDVAASLTGRFDRSPASVVAEKLGKVPGPVATAQMRRGSDLERQVTEAACLLIGASIVDWQAEVTHPVKPWFTVTTDARVRFAEHGPVVPLEVKTTQAVDGYPSDYLEAQLTAQMLCCGVELGVSAVWDLRARTLRVVEHQLHTATAIAVEKMADTLWEALSTGRIPEPTFPADSSLWNQIHPDSVAGVVELPAELVHDLRQSKQAAKAAQVAYDLLEADVKDRLGDFETGSVDGVPAVRWRTGSVTRVDVRALDEKYPEVAALVRATTTQRRFTVISPTSRERR